jgi:hypothetical protein
MDCRGEHDADTAAEAGAGAERSLVEGAGPATATFFTGSFESASSILALFLSLSITAQQEHWDATKAQRAHLESKDSITLGVSSEWFTSAGQVGPKGPA